MTSTMTILGKKSVEQKDDDILLNAKEYTDSEISKLINGAPETLDTLKELASAIEENREAIGEAVANIAIATDDKAGFVKSGGDVTVNTDGTMSVNDDSHKHSASNITEDTNHKFVTEAILNHLKSLTGDVQSQLNNRLNINMSQSTTDFNELKTVGIYHFSISSGVNQTELHTPIGEDIDGYSTVTHYNLIVFGEYTRLSQLCISAFTHNRGMWFRSLHDNTWSPWFRIYTNKDDLKRVIGAATSSALGLVKSGGDVTVGSDGTITINDDSHNHTISNIDGLSDSLDTKADTTLSNLSDKVKALYNIGGAPRKNLADNWDFTNPVNQRGKTQYTQGQYAMDRWVAETGSSVTIKDGYIAIATTTQAIIQRITEAEAKQLNGKTVTVSILTKEGNLATKTGVITYDGTKDIHLGTGSVDGVKFGMSLFPKNKSFQIGRIFGTGNVKAVKTEFGDTQTLAYQKSDGKWELFEHMDYDSELLKCKRYFWRSPVYALWTQIMYSAYVPVNIMFPVEMRITPTVRIFSYEGTLGVLSRWGEADDSTATATPNTRSTTTKGVNGFNVKNYNANQAYSYYIEASADI